MELTPCSLLPLTHHGLSIKSKWEFAMEIATPHAPMHVLASYEARLSNASTTAREPGPVERFGRFCVIKVPKRALPRECIYTEVCPE